jgi:hypothetical protein
MTDSTHATAATTATRQKEFAMSRRHNASSPLRRSVKGLVMAGLVLAVANAHAVLPVTDVVHIATNKFAWVAQYQQMYSEATKQIAQLQTQLDQYRTQLNQYRTQIQTMKQQFVGGLSYQGKAGYREQLTERGLNDNVADRCGNGPGLLSGGPGFVTTIAQKQHQNCVAIVQTDNSRYNAMVRILQSVSKRDAELDAARNAAKDVPADQPGQLVRINNNIAQIEARIAADVQNAKTLLDAYDAALRALNDEQVWLAKKAYRSSDSGLLDGVVQYGTLKAALAVARQRRR